jgi:acyl dehydratase/CBS domain-containing protein
MLVTLSVNEVMSRQVHTVAPTDSARGVAHLLREQGVSSAVVCEDDVPCGIVTESDLVRLLAAEADPDAVAVADFMSSPLVTVAPDTLIEDAAQTLADRRIRRLPVVESGALVGILTSTDVSYYLPHAVRGGQHPADRLRGHPPAAPSGVAYDDPAWEFEHTGADETTVDVGDVVRFRKRLSATDVEAFAEASGDTNRVHLDAAFAARTRFGGRIAHGVLTAGLVSAALARLPGLVIYLSQDLSFRAPVPLGERLTAVCEVVEDLGSGKYELTTVVYDESNEVVLDGCAVVLVDTLPADGEAADAETEAEA